MRVNVEVGTTWFPLETFSCELHFFRLCSGFFILQFSDFCFTEWCVCWQADFKMLIQKSDIFWTDCHWTRQITKNTHLCPASFELGYGIKGWRIFVRFSGRVSKRFFSSRMDPSWLQIQPNWQRDFYSGRWQRIMSKEQCLDSFIYRHDMVFI
jgi:hypothetical protein